MGTHAEGLSTTPADIEATRAELARNVDELGDKVSPHRIVERRTQAVKGRFSGIRDKVMGSAYDARHAAASTGSRTTDTVSSAAGTVSDQVHGAADTLESRVEGNPLAAGLVAFGAGMVIAALIPASDKETRLAGSVVDAAREHGQPVIEEARSVGQDLGQELKESAGQVAQNLKESAQESAQHVKQEGQSSTQTVKDDASPR